MLAMWELVLLVLPVNKELQVNRLNCIIKGQAVQDSPWSIAASCDSTIPSAACMGLINHDTAYYRAGLIFC